MTEKEKKEIIELVHKTLRGFFGPFPEGELGARPLTQTEKTLLEVNKVLCEKIKEIPTVDRQHGEWKHMTVCGVEFINCSNCGFGCPLYSYVKKGEKEEKVQHCETDFCPNCGADMREGESDER